MTIRESKIILPFVLAVVSCTVIFGFNLSRNLDFHSRTLLQFDSSSSSTLFELENPITESQAEFIGGGIALLSLIAVMLSVLYHMFLPFFGSKIVGNPISWSLLEYSQFIALMGLTVKEYGSVERAFNKSFLYTIGLQEKYNLDLFGSNFFFRNLLQSDSFNSISTSEFFARSDPALNPLSNFLSTIPMSHETAFMSVFSIVAAFSILIVVLWIIGMIIAGILRCTFWKSEEQRISKFQVYVQRLNRSALATVFRFWTIFLPGIFYFGSSLIRQASSLPYFISFGASVFCIFAMCAISYKSINSLLGKNSAHAIGVYAIFGTFAADLKYENRTDFLFRYILKIASTLLFALLWDWPGFQSIGLLVLYLMIFIENSIIKPFESKFVLLLNIFLSFFQVLKVVSYVLSLTRNALPEIITISIDISCILVLLLVYLCEVFYSIKSFYCSSEMKDELSHVENSDHGIVRVPVIVEEGEIGEESFIEEYIDEVNVPDAEEFINIQRVELVSNEPERIEFHDGVYHKAKICEEDAELPAYDEIEYSKSRGQKDRDEDEVEGKSYNSQSENMFTVIKPIEKDRLSEFKNDLSDSQGLQRVDLDKNVDDSNPDSIYSRSEEYIPIRPAQNQNNDADDIPAPIYNSQSMDNVPAINEDDAKGSDDENEELVEADVPEEDYLVATISSADYEKIIKNSPELVSVFKFSRANSLKSGIHSPSDKRQHLSRSRSVSPQGKDL